MAAGISRPHRGVVDQGTKKGWAMNFIDRTLPSEAPSDPKLLIVFLQYALDDVRSLSERSAHLLEQAINALAQEIAQGAAVGASSQSLS